MKSKNKNKNEKWSKEKKQRNKKCKISAAKVLSFGNTPRYWGL
jgi:hypothetical protein